MIDKVKPLTREEVTEKLKNMKVGENGIGPFKSFSFIVPNPDYEPESFSQEIEDSEEECKILQKVKEEISKPLFERTENNIEGNSEKWKKNHTKKCEFILWPFYFIKESIVHKDGTRDYYSEEIVDKIMNIGNVINFC